MAVHNLVDMTGIEFGRLRVIRRAGTNNRKHATRETAKSHGMSSTRFYKIWAGMVKRCEKPSHKQFHDYGGRGISVCDRWKTFENFREDMLEKYEAHKEINGENNTTLERLDTEGDYNPDNCVWATRIAQSRNQRVRSSSSTGIRGVSIRKCGKFQASITVAGKRYYLGLFDTVEAAVGARRDAEEKYWA